MGDVSREELLGNLPLQYADGPDYCTVTDATGGAFALTVQPELMKLLESFAAQPAGNDGVREALGKLLLSAKLLQQNAEGCAVNHHALDFEQQGFPGWLIDTEKDIAEAQGALSAPPRDDDPVAIGPDDCAEHMLLQARASAKEQWTNIYAAQLQHFAGAGYDVRAVPATAPRATAPGGLDQAWEKINALGGRSDQDNSYDQGLVDTVAKVLEIIEALGGKDPQPERIAARRRHNAKHPLPVTFEKGGQ